MNIFIHEMKTNLKSLIIWALSLLFIVGVVSFEFEAFQGNEEIQKLMDTDMYKQFFVGLGVDGIDIISPEGFLSILSIYFYVPLSIFSGLLGANIISKEEKNKTAEYLFTLPISRGKVLLSKFVAGLVNIMVINIIIISGAMLIFGRFDTSDNFYPFLMNMSLGVFVTQFIFYSVGIGLASVLKDYKKSGAITIGILLGTFMLSVLSNMVEEADFLRFITPFRYYEAGSMLLGEFFIEYILLSLVFIMIGVSSLFYFYPKRDLYI